MQLGEPLYLALKRRKLVEQAAMSQHFVLQQRRLAERVAMSVRLPLLERRWRHLEAQMELRLRLGCLSRRIPKGQQHSLGPGLR